MFLFSYYHASLFINNPVDCVWTELFLREVHFIIPVLNLLYAQFKRLPQDISQPWLHWLKLTYHPSSITNNVSKNWSMTLKGLRGVVLRALIEKTPNFWPIEPIELKFWHLILIIECMKISLCGSHGSSFGPLPAKLQPSQRSKTGPMGPAKTYFQILNYEYQMPKFQLNWSNRSKVWCFC